MKPTEQIRDKFLFHGTGETITGNLRGGGYDGILWTAEESTVAQNYIPSAGVKVGFAQSWYTRSEDNVRPEGVAYELAKQLGYEADIELDIYNRISSWRWKNNNCPKNQIIFDYIENELGYVPDENGVYRLKATFKNEILTYLHSNYKTPGLLYIAEGKEQLNIFDYTKGRETDINNPDYNQLKLFRKIESEGYDAIKIHDYAQSENWGNVSHMSIGLFPRGIEKMKFESITATNWDWSEDKNAFDIKDTPEFLEWLTKKGHL